MSTTTSESGRPVASWGPDGPGGHPSGPLPTPQAVTRHRVLWAVGAVAVVLLLLAGVVAGLAAHLTGQVTRIPAVFSSLDAAARPAPAAGTTFLVVGTDARTPGDPAVMLATVSPDGTRTGLVSFPRATTVPVPGHGTTTLTAAYALGGPALLTASVEQATGVRVEHFAAIDFAQFGDMADAAGGINVEVAAPTSSDGVTFPAGPQHLDGRAALAYVRQENGLPGGDLDRIHRQQNGLRALVGGAVGSGTMSNPFSMYGLADAVTAATSVDDTMTNADLRSLAWGLSDLRTRNMSFVVAPTTPGPAGPAPVALLNAPADRDLWTAVSSDQVAGYVAGHPGSALPAAPR